MKRCIFYILFINCCLFLTAQVNIIDIKKNPKENETFVYDSLCNISLHMKYNGKNSLNYLIGQKMIYINKYNNPFYMYLYKKESYTRSDSLVGKTFEVIEALYNPDHIYYDVPLLLKETESGNMYEYKVNENDNQKWVVVGYYEKIKNSHVGKNYVYIKEVYHGEDRDGLISFDTDEKLTNVPENSIWKCTDISIKLRDPKDYSWVNDKRCPIILIFENDKLGKCYCYLENERGYIFKNEYYDWEEDKRDLFLSKFQAEDEYYVYKQNQLILAKAKKKQQMQMKAALIKKYGATYGALIATGKVRIGMTKKMCKESWGEPESINRTTGSYGIHEQWVYGDGNYLYFENGRLSDIQN